MLSAKVAGALYLAMLVTGVFAGFTSGPASIIANLVTCAGDVALVAALYVLLRPVHRNAAITAAVLRTIEIAISGTGAFRIAAIFFALGSALFNALLYR